jgi:NADH dehydrogenase FAD-containing subunit
LLKFVRIKVIEASKTVLAPFDESLQQEAIKQLKRTIAVKDPMIYSQIPQDFKLTELLLESSVKEVTEKTIELNDGTSIHYGMSVWAAGNGPLPLTLQLIDALGESQAAEQSVARGRVATDPWLRVIGGQGKILAFGDCSCITKGQLPATAQVASQQGEYLASLMNKNYNFSPDEQDGIFLPPVRDPNQAKSTSESIAAFANQGDGYAKPFQFLNLGILAYTGGGSALAQVEVAPDAAKIKGSGQLGNAVWRSVYLTKQVSWRNRLLVANDWAKRQIFGRDITQV